MIDGSDWRNYVARCFPAHVQAISSMRARPSFDSGEAFEDLYRHPLGTTRAVNVRNENDLRRADAVLVNLLGATGVSVPAVAEMAFAHQLNIPIIAAMEPCGNVHDHPMLNQWIDCRALILR